MRGRAESQEAERLFELNSEQVESLHGLMLANDRLCLHLTGIAGRFGLTGGFFFSSSIAIAIAFSS